MQTPIQIKDLHKLDWLVLLLGFWFGVFGSLVFFFQNLQHLQYLVSQQNWKITMTLLKNLHMDF